MAQSPEVEDMAADGLAELAEPAERTAVCPECPDPVPVKGNMSPAMAVGLHRRHHHGYVSANPKRPRKGDRDKRAGTAKPVSGITVLHDAAGEAKGKGAPSADALGKAFGRIYGYGSVLAAGWLVDSDPRDLTDEQRNRFVEMLSASPDEAASVGRPFGRFAAPTGLNKKFGRALVDNVDIIDALAVIADQVQRFGAYRREVRRFMAEQQPSGYGPPVPPQPVPGTTADTTTEPDGFRHTTPMTRGVVVTPDMVRGGPVPQPTGA